MQLDLTNMTEIVYNEHTGIATLGPGLRSKDIYTVLNPLGRTVVSGTCLPVGFSGLALGGGFGLISRQFGLAMDRVVGFEVVLANGSVVVADSGGFHADLYWALRGGGHANFGVVTAFHVQTVDVSTASFQYRQYNSRETGPSTPAAAALVAWQAFATAVGREVFTELSFGTYMTGDPGFTIVLAVNGTAEGADALFAASGLLEFVAPVNCSAGGPNPVNPASPPLPFDCSNLTYGNLTELVGHCGLETNRAFSAASLYQNGSKARFTVAGAQAVWDAYANIHERYGCVPQWASIIFDDYGGAIADPLPGATAFPHRSAGVMLELDVFWEIAQGGGSEPPPGCSDWFNALYSAASVTLGTAAAYANYPSLDLGAEYGERYFGDNYGRLQSLKAVVDPCGVFEYPQAIAADPPTDATCGRAPSVHTGDAPLTPGAIAGITLGTALAAAGIVAAVIFRKKLPPPFSGVVGKCSCRRSNMGSSAHYRLVQK